MDCVLWFCRDDSADDTICLSTNAGCDGRGRLTISLLSIETTVAIIGLSVARFCKQRSPMCMHLSMSFTWFGLDISGSITDWMSFSFHNFQAWNQNKNQLITVKTTTNFHNYLQVIVYFQNKEHSLERLTNPKRLNDWSWSKQLLIFLPLIISSNKTPKPKTSNFSETNPWNAYSGGI